MIRFTSRDDSDILLADAVMTVPSPSLNLPPVDCKVTNKMSVSSPVLVQTGCNHESRLSGTGVVAVGADVSGTTDTDPQAMTASIIARQDVIRTL